ncbi:uncharacterized protein TA03550 [Theileria annulata]|uniref:Uncharacterized protein n=1 Tax=Theileria annulata TaxID=5874 RepID=Q4UCI7_THEAN|nr:uncharacterized protein TA03550 [Theileria annulata]CAI75464.1 hypothetical protein TA03550 [Theileria annulata]|eukprot:XP_954940.1 hypothetical protein TA03550 [Theileria annulata]
MDDTEAFNDFAANTVYDLFADDDEDLYLNEEEYEQTKPSEGVDEFSRKRNAKLGPFSTDTFWKRADDRRYDLKNHLWDFMIYNSIREQSFGNYKGQVEMMNSQLMLSIAECKNNVLNSLNELDHFYKKEQSDPGLNNYYENNADKNLDDEHKNQVEACFDKLIRVVLDKFRIKLDLTTSESNDNSGFEDMTTSPRSDNINKQICEYLKSRKQVRQLFREFADYRRTKNQLIRKSLHELLKSFNEFRNKILQEVYQDSKGNKMNLTRFVKNMDKVTSRFDFFCEYRFHNLATYFRNKEEVDNYIDSFVAFNTFTDDFSQFNNNFNPNLRQPTPTTTSRTTTDTFVGETAQTKTTKDKTKIDKEPEQMPREIPTEEDEMESIFNFMGGDVSQNFIQTQDQSEIKQKSDSRSGEYKDMNLDEDNAKRMEFDNNPMMESKVVKDRQKEEEDDLKLLQEARKKAAEILRYTVHTSYWVVLAFKGLFNSHLF